MYKLLKKTVCVLLIVALFAGIALEASAVEGPSMDEAFDEYFTFTGKQRIDNNGSFGFNFRSELRSAQKFTVSKSIDYRGNLCYVINMFNVFPAPNTGGYIVMPLGKCHPSGVKFAAVGR